MVIFTCITWESLYKRQMVKEQAWVYHTEIMFSVFLGQPHLLWDVAVLVLLSLHIYRLLLLLLGPPQLLLLTAQDGRDPVRDGPLAPLAWGGRSQRTLLQQIALRRHGAGGGRGLECPAAGLGPPSLQVVSPSPTLLLRAELEGRDAGQVQGGRREGHAEAQLVRTEEE